MVFDLKSLDNSKNTLAEISDDKDLRYECSLIELGQFGGILKIDNNLKLEKINKVYKVRVMSKEYVEENRFIPLFFLKRDNSTAVFFRWIEPSLKDVENEKRKNERFYLRRSSMPIVIFSNPKRFNDFILGKIIDFSNDGLRIETSLRNKFIVSGMRLEGHLMFPSYGSSALEVEIKWSKMVFNGLKNILEFGGVFTDDYDKIKDILINFYLNNCSVYELSRINNFGIKKNIDKKFFFANVLEHEDYILSVKNRKIEDDELIFDYDSMIVNISFFEKLVGCFRMALFDVFDNSKILSDVIDVPSDMPASYEMMEVTDFSFLTNDRKMILSELLEIVAFSISHALISKRKWILVSFKEEKFPIFSKFGFSKLRCETKSNNIVAIMNIEDFFQCKMIKLFDWIVILKALERQRYKGLSNEKKMPLYLFIIKHIFV